MPVRFVDMNGSEGWISDDLSLSYFGPAETTESIEAFIAELEADGMTTEEQIQELVVELPGRCAIRAIERVNGAPED